MKMSWKHMLFTAGSSLLVIIAATGLVSPVSAGTAAGMSGERVVVSIRTFQTAVDGVTRSSGSVSLQLAPGESGAASVACGFFDKQGEVIHRYAMGGVRGLDPSLDPPFSSLPDNHPTVWGIRCTLQNWEAGEISLDVEWMRSERQAAGSAARGTRGRRTITFAEEGRHLLDFIGAPGGEPDSAGLVNRTVELDVAVAEAPALAACTIRYDLWLVDEADGGERISRPLRLFGRQGEKLDFSFEEIRRTVPGIALDQGGTVETLMEITGNIRGRVRPDGSIVITLNSGRRFGLAAAGEDSPGWSGNGRGMKYFTVAPGETVSTLYPEPGGQSILYRQTGSRPATPGVTVTDEFIKVRFGPFFEGHAVSLVLSAASVP